MIWSEMVKLCINLFQYASFTRAITASESWKTLSSKASKMYRCTHWWLNTHGTESYQSGKNKMYRTFLNKKGLKFQLGSKTLSIQKKLLQRGFILLWMAFKCALCHM